MFVRPTRRFSTHSRLAAATLAVVLALSAATGPGAALHARAQSGRTQTAPPRAPLVAVRHGAFMANGRPLPYLHGINYEGPADRPWHMWEDGRFNPTLIAHDFDLIAAAGYNPVRVFVQHPLPDEILAGDYARLDAVVALAAARGLRLLITFNDDGDSDLRRVTRVDALIAAHLAGNSAVFGYDLRNEPGLPDIAAARYPDGVALPLFAPALIGAYHERVSMSTVRAVQASGQWSHAPFDAMDTRTLYYYLNARHLYDSFVAENPAYPAVPASPYWTPFLTAANGTLAAYLNAQLAAVRAADPTHVVTVGYNARFWAALPANTALDFRSIHIYPPANYDGFHAALRLFEAINALAPSPLVLEEYGVSNDLNGRQSAAVRETAAALYLRTLGGGGDLKWMFSDDAAGYNSYENNLGAVDTSNLPKPTYLVSGAIDAYNAQTPYSGGLALHPDPVTGAGFVFAARDALALGGSLPYADVRVRYTPNVAGVLWLDWSTPGLLRVTPTSDGRLTLALGALTGATALTSAPTVSRTAPLTTTTPTTTTTITTTTVSPITSTVAVSGALAAAGPTGALAAAGPTVTLALHAGVVQTLHYQALGAPPPTPVDLPAPDLSGWYVVERGHNVAAPFLNPWQNLGGADTLGLPVTEAFTYRGLPTQYFDNLALRIGPRGVTTAPLGVVALGGNALPRARELPARTPHVYDTTTGHNLHGAFLDYWRRTGGPRFWGPPISEEMRENGRAVQYVAGGEFTITPPPHGHVILLPLGDRMWPSVRKVYGL